jgi:hypothetical protein
MHSQSSPALTPAINATHISKTRAALLRIIAGSAVLRLSMLEKVADVCGRLDHRHGKNSWFSAIPAHTCF